MPQIRLPPELQTPQQADVQGATALGPAPEAPDGIRVPLGLGSIPEAPGGIRVPLHGVPGTVPASLPGDVPPPVPVPSPIALPEDLDYRIERPARENAEMAAKRYSGAADLDTDDPFRVPAPAPPPGVDFDYEGITTRSVPTADPDTGVMIDRLEFGSFTDPDSTLYQVHARLLEKEARSIIALEQPLTNEQKAETRARLRNEALRYTAALIEGRDATPSAMDPTRMLTPEIDNAALAEGLLPTAGVEGNLAGRAANLQRAVLDMTEGVLEEGSPARLAFDLMAMPLPGPVAAAAIKATTGKAPIEWVAPGLIDDAGAIGRIPERIGLVPARATAAMLYPHHGYGRGDWNLLHKVAQDFVFPVLAVQEHAKGLRDADDGLTYSESVSRALAAPDVIDRVRNNESSYEMAERDQVPMSLSGFWLGWKALTGGNVFDTVEEIVGINPADNAVMDFQDAAQAFLLRPGRSMAALPGALTDDEPLSRESLRNFRPAQGPLGALMGVDPLPAGEFSRKVLGPLAVAVSTPDILFGGLGMLKTARSATKSAKLEVYARGMEREGQVWKDLDEAFIAAGDDIAAQEQAIGAALADPRLSTSAREALLEQVRKGVGGSPQAQNFAGRIQKHTKAAETAERNVQDLLASLPKVEGAPMAPRRATFRSFGTETSVDGWAPTLRFQHLSDAVPPEQVLQVAKREMAGLQYKLAAVRAQEALVETSIARLEKLGALVRGSSKAKGAAPALVEFKAAARALDDAMTRMASKGDDAAREALSKAQVRYRNAMQRHVSASGAAADNAVYGLRELLKSSGDGLEALLVEATRVLPKAPGANQLRVAHRSFMMDLNAMLKSSPKDLGLSRAKTPILQAKGLEAGVRFGGVRSMARAMSESTAKSAARLRAGENVAEEVSLYDFYRFKGTKTEDLLREFRGTYGGEVFDALRSNPVLQGLEKGVRPSDVQLSELVRTFATRASADPFGAWSMGIHLAKLGNLRLRGESAAYQMFAHVDAVVKNLKIGPLLKRFGVGNEETLNIARMGVSFSQMGLDDLGATMGLFYKHVMRKVDPEQAALAWRKAHPTATKLPRKDVLQLWAVRESAVTQIRGFLTEALPTGGTSRFRSGGSATPFEEAIAAWRKLGEEGAKNAQSFHVAAKAFGGTGTSTGSATKQAVDSLAKLVFKKGKDGTYTRFTYDDLAAHSRKPFGESASALDDVRSHTFMAAGLINAASLNRVFDSLAARVAGFDTKALRSAQGLAGSKEKVFDAAQGLAVLEKLGIPPRTSRNLARKQREIVELQGLRGVDGADDAIKALVPTSYMKAMEDGLARFEKAADPVKAATPASVMRTVGTNVQRAMMLMRWGLTTGIIAPKASYYYKNLVGVMGQVSTSRGHAHAVMNAIASRGQVPWQQANPVYIGYTPIDGAFSRIIKHNIEKFKTDNVLPPIQVRRMNQWVNGMFDSRLMPDDFVFTTKAGESLTKGQLIREMAKEGVYSTKASTLLLEDAGVALATGMPGGSFVDRMWQALKKNPTRYSRWMDDLESGQRVAAYMQRRIREGASAAESGALVREAYFDWSYTHVGLATELRAGIPMLMFPTMWENGIRHTVAALMDPAKAKRMMDLWKAGDITTRALSEPGDADMESLRRELPWWSQTSGQHFITRQATDEEAMMGVRYKGAPTTTMATALPNIMAHDLSLMMFNTALQTALFIDGAGRTRSTGLESRQYKEHLLQTGSTFLNPVAARLLGVDTAYESYDGKLTASPSEAKILGMAGIPVQYKHAASETGYRYRAPSTGVWGTRLMPGLNRVARDLEPVMRRSLSTEANDFFLQALEPEVWREVGALELGAPAKPVQGGAGRLAMEQLGAGYEMREIK